MALETIVTHTVVIKFKPKDVDLLAQSEDIAAKLVNNADVPTTVPPLSTLTTANTAFDKAITAARTKAVGTKGVKVGARKTVKETLNLLKAPVQAAVNNAPDRALIIAQGCGMSIRTTTIRVKPDIALTQPKAFPSGTALGERKAIPGDTSSEWMISLDGGKTFSALPGTIPAKTQIPNLVPGTSVVIRHRFLTRKGYKDWAQSQPLIVR